MVRLEGNTSLKNPVTPPGIDPGTVRLVAQRLNHYATINLIYKLKFIKEIASILHLPMLTADFLQLHPQLQRTSPLRFEWRACKCLQVQKKSVLRHQPPTVGSIVCSNPAAFNRVCQSCRYEN